MNGPSTEVGIVRVDRYNVEKYHINITNDTYNDSIGNPESGDSILSAVIYSLMFILSAGSNIPVLFTLLKNQKRKCRLNLMFLHLVISDLIVTIFVIPLEITTDLPVQWVAGNAACKFLIYMRAFGPNILSSILAAISMDIYYTILHPLKVNDALRRSKIFLTLAWAASILSSIPQVSWF
ncbi:gonadotropin-releasing hormone receptor [Trichonephila inaurata madagascariensis]|uniref:Gonadotropin-releasing hormone receptor n=1 Tax=Trichonephila inaurata madagascariensis TaxID=2747483 RepID=A0A8X6M8F9_9ARAC|nr:gonadotropin-releasing hormone receptor [Trichonephila inaurata madagascariensis]